MNFEDVKANRQKWIDFLREEGRVKAVNILDNGNEKRCCLGHACFVLGVTRHVERMSNGVAAVYYGKQWNRVRAPDELVELLGLNDNLGRFKDGALTHASRERFSLADINDSTHATPKEIADFIEANYDQVFMDEETYNERYSNDIG